MRAVNLIPSEQRKGGAVGRRSQGAAFAVLALLAGAAILVFLYGSAKHQLESHKSEAAALTARASRVQTQAAQLTPYTSFMQLREQRLQEIAQLINSRFAWSSAMGELSRVLPSTVALNSITATVGSPASSGSSSATASSGSSSATATKSSSSSAAPSASSSSPSASASPASAAAGATASTAASVSSATPAGATPTFVLAGCAASQIVVAQMLVRLRLISGVSNVSLQSSTRSGSSGGSSSGGTCPPEAPVFSVDITFQPLPTPPVTSTEALESTVSNSNANANANASGTHDRTVTSAAKGTSR
jgi:Tfp pilus assembly protein PilN